MISGETFLSSPRNICRLQGHRRAISAFHHITADRSILMYFMFAAEIGNGSFMRTASSYSHIITAPTTRIGVEKGPNTKRTVDIVDALFFQPYSQTLTAFSTRYLLFRLRVAIIRLS